MKPIRLIIIFLTIATSQICTFSQISKSERYRIEINRMLESTSARETMIISISNGWRTMNLPLTDYNAAAAAVVDEIWPDLVNIYIAEYKKYFTLSDLEVINYFYETPTGRKFSKYTTTMTNAIQHSIEAQLLPRVAETVRKYVKK